MTIDRPVERPYVGPMEIGGHSFTFVCKIDPDRGADGVVMPFMLQARYANARGLPLHRYGDGPFCRYRIPGSYCASGVYAYVVDGVPMYLGRCENLSSRINSGYGNISPKNCFSGGQQANCRVNSLIYKTAVAGTLIALYFHRTADFIAVEAHLLASDKPPWNLRRPSRNKRIPLTLFDQGTVDVDPTVRSPLGPRSQPPGAILRCRPVTAANANELLCTIEDRSTEHLHTGRIPAIREQK